VTRPIDSEFEHVYDYSMSLSRPASSEDWMTRAVLESQFQSIVAEGIWPEVPEVEVWPEVDTWLEVDVWPEVEIPAPVPPGQRLGQLLAHEVGPDLVRSLDDIDAAELDADERLMYLHLWERCSAWIQDQAAAAAAGFNQVVYREGVVQPYKRAGVEVTDHVTLQEVAVASGVSTDRAAMRIITGTAFAADGPLAATGEAVRAGRMSWEVAMAFVDSTLGLTDEHTTAVQNRVLPRAICVIDPDTGEGCWRTRAWAVRQLRRAVIAVDPETVIRRREENSARRYVNLSFDHSSGSAYLTALLPTHLAMELHDTLNALAARLRDEDASANPEAAPRGWQAARADALVAVIREAGAVLATTGVLPSVQGKTRIEVGVIIDLPTLLHMADHPGEILGYGPIDPDYSRLLAAEADVWRRWVVDPISGHLLDLGRTRYRPNQELRDYILAAYPECSVPECNRHTPGLEIDHVMEWGDDGPTSAANLHALCWRDHQHKTGGHINMRMNADGTVTHTTRHGLTRLHEPYWRSQADDLAHGRTEPNNGEPPF